MRKKIFILLICVLTIGILSVVVSKIVLKELHPKKYEDLVIKYATLLLKNAFIPLYILLRITILSCKASFNSSGISSSILFKTCAT